MATRDRAQLILEVDARIATAQRDLNRLARSLQQDATNMDKSLGKIEQSGQRVAKSLGSISNRTRSGFTQLSFQIGDVTQGLAMGTRASTIFAQQSGQVIQALQIMGGEGNKFLRFLGGPWGLAISTAAVVLGTFAGKLFESGDEVGKLVEKMREQARQAANNKRADEAWKATIEGLTDAIRKRREEQEKALQTDIQAEQSSLEEAKRELAGLRRERTRLLADQREAERTLGVVSGARPFEGQASAIANAQKKVDDLKRQVAGVQGSIREAEAAVRAAQIPIAERNVEAKIDPVKKATDAYTRTLGDLRKALEAGSISQATFENRLEAAKRKLDAVKDSAKETRKSVSGLPAVTGEEIAKALGTTITSGKRSSAQNKAVGGAPNSYHLSGQAIDIPLTVNGRPLTKEGIRAALEPLGVEIKELLGPGDKGHSDHFHIAFNKRRLGSDQIAARAARESRSGVRQENAFEESLERLNRELLQAKTELLQGTDAQADAAIELLQLEQERLKKAIQNDVEEGKLTQAQADTLKIKIDQITFERAKSVELGRQLAHMERQSEAEERQFQYRIDDLRFADELARTQSEHRRVQLDILDIVYEQKEAALRDLKARLVLADEIEEAARVQEQIDRLPTEKAQDRSRTVRGTMNPLEAWADSIPQTAEDIIEAFQAIEARGIDSLANAITDVITGTRSLKDAFSDLARSVIADIIQMTVRMLIFRAISGIFGGGGGTSPITYAAKGAVFGGGNVVPFASGGIIDRMVAFPLSGGKTGVAGEAGTEAIMPLARDSMGRLGVRAANTASSAPLEIVIHTVASEDFIQKVEVVSAQQVARAAPVIVKTAVGQTMRAASRPRLMGSR